MEVFAANAERPPKLHLADEPRHTTANPWRCAVARPAHSAAQIALAPSQFFPEDSSARRHVANENEFQGCPATIPRRATVPELPHQFAPAQDTPAPAHSEPSATVGASCTARFAGAIASFVHGAANSAKPIRRMAIRSAAKFSFRLQIALPLHQKEKVKTARSHNVVEKRRLRKIP